MRRVYSNVHIALISALLLAVVAFEAGAIQHAPLGASDTGAVYSALEVR